MRARRRVTSLTERVHTRCSHLLMHCSFSGLSTCSLTKRVEQVSNNVSKNIYMGNGFSIRRDIHATIQTFLVACFLFEASSHSDEMYLFRVQLWNALNVNIACFIVSLTMVCSYFLVASIKQCTATTRKCGFLQESEHNTT